MINWNETQKALAAHEYDPGPIDGVPGARTYAALFSFVAARPLGQIGLDLGTGATHAMPRFLINEPLRLAHFLGQSCHETEGYRFFTEIWGPTEAQRGYEGRSDLGNTHPGDGFLFRGRGLFQITGRANYLTTGMRIQVPLTATPDLAARPDIAVLTACDFWATRKLNDYADRDDLVGLTHKINGGSNGLTERAAMTARAKEVLL